MKKLLFLTLIICYQASATEIILQDKDGTVIQNVRTRDIPSKIDELNRYLVWTTTTKRYLTMPELVAIAEKVLRHPKGSGLEFVMAKSTRDCFDFITVKDPSMHTDSTILVKPAR